MGQTVSQLGSRMTSFALVLWSFGGYECVLWIDLCTFAAGASALLWLVRIPPVTRASDAKRAGGTLAGIRFLKHEQPALLRLIVFFAFVNLLASMSGNGLMPAMVLACTGGDALAVGTASSLIGVGTLLAPLVGTGRGSGRRRCFCSRAA